MELQVYAQLGMLGMGIACALAFIAGVRAGL